MQDLITNMNGILKLVPKKNHAKVIQILFEITSVQLPIIDTEKVFVDPRVVIKAACKVMDVDPIDVMRKDQSHHLVSTRYMCYKFMREKMHMTYGRIGQFFNGKDHSTVLHGYNVLNQLLSVDKTYRSKYELFLAELNQKTNDKPSPIISQSAVNTSGTPTDIYVHRTVNN